MNEFLRNYIMKCIRDMIKNGIALYQTYQYSLGWYSNGVLLQEDLEEIQKMYEEKEQLAEDTELDTNDSDKTEIIEEESEEEQCKN